MADWTSLVAPVSGVVSTLAVACGGTFAALKWWDVRATEQKQRRDTEYNRLMLTAWGWRDETGGSVAANVQIAAYYRLLNYREYAFATAKSIEACSARGQGDWLTNVKPVADEVVAMLKNTNEYSKQAREFSGN